MNITEKATLDAIRKYKNIKARIAELESELDVYKVVIIDGMGGEDTATAKIGGVSLTVTNKAVTTTRLDTKALKAKYPAIAAECAVTSTAPRFTIK